MSYLLHDHSPEAAVARKTVAHGTESGTVMALFHCHVGVIRKGVSGGSQHFAQYIFREEQQHAVQAARYIHREGRSNAKEDLVDKGHASLPAWAHDNPVYFFAMADTYELGGAHRPGTVARTFEIALPREMDGLQRAALAADIRATFFERYPMAWAIHNPHDEKKVEYPHMHVMMSERRCTDGIERAPQQYFRKAAAPWQDPATHGVRKDRSWQGPTRLRELRAGIATLTNAALERGGYASAVSHESLKTQGHEREACIYTKGQDKAAIDEQRKELRRVFHPGENECALATWEAQKRHEGIRDLSRQAMIDHVRDRFFQHDHSLARDLERAESLERTMERAYARTGRVRAPDLEGRGSTHHALQVTHVRPTPRGWDLGWRSPEDDVQREGVHVRLEHGMEVER